jgi:hypothetical protein
MHAKAQGNSRNGQLSLGMASAREGRVSAPPADLALTRLQPEQAVALLVRAGAHSMSLERLRADQAAGAPANPDGTINLIAYGAWMLQEQARREGRREP